MHFVKNQGNIWKKQLAENLLDIYPEALNFFRDDMGQKNSALALNVSADLVEESLGKLSVQPRFNADAVRQYIDPIRILIELPAEKDKPTLLQQCKGSRQVLLMLQSNLDDYIAYWGGYGDSLDRTFATWEDFHKCCATLKPYEVNTLLMLIYRKSGENLKMIPDAALSKDQMKKRDDAVAVLNNRIQTLSPVFAQICISQVSAWALLPDSALAAYHQLSNLPGKQLKSEYLAVVAVGKKCDIPWWDKFFRNGSALLKQNAQTELLTPMQTQALHWMRFPLIADDNNSLPPMSQADLLNVQQGIRDIGFAPAAPAADPGKDQTPAQQAVVTNDPKISFANLGIAAKMDPKMQDWGLNLQVIIDAVLNPMKELVWSISVMDKAARAKWTSGKLTSYPDTAYRFRYWDLRMKDAVIGKKASTSAKTTFSSTALDSDLEMRFFLFQSDTEPAVTVTIPGPWAVFRLYLSPNAVYDSEKGVVHVPVTVTDKKGQDSIFWLTLSFNKKLPSPAQWPTTKTWPEFSKVQTSFQESRTVKKTDWNALFTSAKDYDMLVKQLQDYDRGQYPKLSVIFPGLKPGSHAFRYRYMQMLVPGVKTSRIQITGRPADLGTVQLQAAEIRFAFFMFEEQKEPSYVVTVPGTYAPLRLLTAPGRKCGKDGIDIEWNTGKDVLLPLRLKISQ